MKKNKSLTTKGLIGHKVLATAITLGVMSGCLMAAPVYAERIDDSQSFNSDTTIDVKMVMLYISILGKMLL